MRTYGIIGYHAYIRHMASHGIKDLSEWGALSQTARDAWDAAGEEIVYTLTKDPNAPKVPNRETVGESKWRNALTDLTKPDSK